MPYAPNPLWTAKTEEANQSPVYFLDVEGLPFRFSTHPVRGASVAYKPLMKTPSGATQEIFPLEGRSSIGGVSVTLVDEGGVVTATLATDAPAAVVPTWINRACTLYGGYAGLDESHYAPLFRGQVADWRMAPDGSYTLHIADLKRATLEDIMQNATREHPTLIEGNPLDIWYAIVTGDFADSAFPVIVSGAPPTGLNVSPSLVDKAHLASERDDWLFGWRMRFEFRTKTKAKRFFEEELFLLKGYPVIRPDGRLSVRLYHPAHPASPRTRLTSDDIVGIPSARPRFKDHRNGVRISGDHHPDGAAGDGAEFSLLAEIFDADDAQATHETKIFAVESRGLRSALDGKRNARFAAGKIRQRFLRPPLEVEAETFFTKRGIEAGEVIFVSHPHLPNLATGARGWTDVPCEVVKAQPDFRKGRMRLTLLATGFNRRYRVIAPSGLAEYSAQTAAEREKYLSVASSPEETFSNGDAAHQLI